MFEVEVISTFSAAHRLRDYNGKCEHLHGHNYRVHVTARSETTVAGGMVMDFGELKEAATTVLDGLDHCSVTLAIKPISCTRYPFGSPTLPGRPLFVMPSKRSSPPCAHVARTDFTTSKPQNAIQVCI
jgi:hypothetical protein